MKKYLIAIRHAIVITFVAFGVLHLCIILFYALTHQTTQPLNAFSIIGLDLIFPNLVTKNNASGASWIIVGVIFLINLYLSSYKKR